MGEPSTSAAAPKTPLSITIRFANSLPDLTIYVASSTTTSIASLKRQIREARPEDFQRRRLRLIYSGKVPGDGSLLSDVVRPSKPPPPPPPPPPTKRSLKGKEKASPPLVQEEEAGKVWIHCSVGDELSDEELAKEAESEITTPTHTPSTLPQPLGFDRLLSAGFSEADVAALRSQFNRLHGHNGGEDVRVLEDRWIDESAGQGQELVDGSPAGTYEDMFIGTAIGFFWPVAIFFMREEGIFTKRRQMAIIAGMLVNLAFSVLRFSS